MDALYRSLLWTRRDPELRAVRARPAYVALAFAADALRSRLAPCEDLRDLLESQASAIRSARAMGGLVRSEGEARGIVVWERSGPLGVAVRLLYLSPPRADVAGYRDLLALTERTAGPIAFLPGPLAGLSAD